MSTSIFSGAAVVILPSRMSGASDTNGLTMIAIPFSGTFYDIVPENWKLYSIYIWRDFGKHLRRFSEEIIAQCFLSKARIATNFTEPFCNKHCFY